MKEDLADFYNLWDEFLKAWPLSRIQEMSLSEYTAVGNRDTFTYWIESRLDKIGSIWGGSAFKFGIYSRNSSEKKETLRGRTYTEQYAWYSKYGATAEEAFKSVRGIIISIINAVGAQDYDALEKIDFGNALKWKIAFHYQNRSTPVILPIFASRALRALTDSPAETPISIMHESLLKKMPKGCDLLDFGERLWCQYEGIIAVEEEAEEVSDNIKTNEGPFYSGLILGEGTNAYQIARITAENIELKKIANNVNRFIPTVVIKELCKALDEKKIELSDLQRRQNSGGEHVFDMIGFNHDKYIMGYDATIYKLCEYYLENRTDVRDKIPLSKEALFLAMETASLVVRDYVTISVCSALHAKPFLLFTGLSGSGKTQLTQAFSKWICADESQAVFIAVGADWTSNENLLGYPDALKEKSYRKPDNGALDLILRAKDDPENPYFLVLDEMNLSHVERYFADFLSAMESGEAISLHDDTGADWSGVPAKLEIPKNLFVIGTVNVDETTYMFSPKVLDRANVIEFRVSKEEMESFLENPVKPNLDAIAGQGATYAKAFVAAAKQKDVSLEDATREQVSAVLMEFFPQLKEAGAEFGYRTAHEICRFVYFHKELSGESWEFNSAMDAAIMQKLLPKLHGSKKKLGPILEKLNVLCGERFTASSEKIVRMQRRLAEHGFTSFAEA